MLTRRQAKLQGVAVGAEPPPVERTLIDNLSDLSLELAFSYLNTEDLINASQVCRRWRDLCSSRRLWSGRRVPYQGETSAESVRVVRLLRREHGVVPYDRVTLTTGTPRVSFEDGGDTLAIVTSSSMMLVLCLRHLVKDHVTKLHISEWRDLLTPLEALFVWETIASKTKLQTLFMSFFRSNSLIETNFKWPQRGSLIALFFWTDDSQPPGPLCRPIQSLLQLHRFQLQRVYIPPEDQQPLLQFRPTGLRNLQAVLLPSLIDVLKPMTLLIHVHLHSAKQDPALSRRVLTEVLVMPNIRRSLLTLEVTFSSVSNVSEGEDVIALLGDFKVLVWLRLRGVCSVLGDPERGPGALQALLTAVPRIRELTLDLEPFSFPLGALLPHTADGVTSEPLVRMPDSLALLVLGRAKVERRVAEASKWLQQLRRVMVDSTNLHVQCEDVRLHAEGRAGRGRGARHSKVVFLPHPSEHYCQSCPGVAAKKKGYSVMFIGEFVKE